MAADRPPTELETRILNEGRKVLEAGADCLRALAASLDRTFVAAVELILARPGTLVTTGIGKAGHVARKISATFASTGTRSIFVHPTEALHGDLGRIREDDIVLALSNSGSSEEVVRLIPGIRSIGATLIAFTAEPASLLGREADLCLAFGRHDEAGHLGLAPTTSTTAMQGLGDALAMAVLIRRDFTPAEFARFHPGGALGRSLMRVQDVMRRGERNPVASVRRPLFEVLKVMSETPGRPGAASLVDADGRLEGFYTDGDFRRHVEAVVNGDANAFFQRPIEELMTRNPKTARPEMLVAEAMRLLRASKIDQLPVVDARHRPIGLVDVQDLLDVRILG